MDTALVIAYLASLKPELQPHVEPLFTDIVMPEMKDRQLAELAVETRRGLRVLYTTGYTTETP